MGTQILEVAVASRGRLSRTGGMKLAEKAACACLERASRRADEIDLLVNAGIYHDKNLGEPALAALIQEDIGANPHVDEHALHGTFSFDVENGGAGVVTALHLIDGFLRSGIGLALVVASDAAPGSAVEPAFPFASTGAAALLVPEGSADQGFVDFGFDTYPEYESLMTSQIAWRDRRIRRGRNVLELHVDPGFSHRAVECAVDSVSRFLERVGQSRDDIDLWIPSQWPRSFPDAFARALDLPGDRVARVSDDLAGAHTAGPLAAVREAQRDGRWPEARTVLFVTVGAGIDTGLALYRNA